jgi:hypothetical protein
MSRLRPRGAPSDALSFVCGRVVPQTVGIDAKPNTFMKEQQRTKAIEASQPFEFALRQRETVFAHDPDHLVPSGAWRARAAHRLEFPGLRHTVAGTLARIATATIAVIGRA